MFEYFKTPPGILKILQLLVSSICAGCSSPVILDYIGFFVFVVATTGIMTLIMCLVYLFRLEKLLSKKLFIMETAATCGGFFLYLLGCIVMMCMTTRHDIKYALNVVGYYNKCMAASVFSLFNTLLYGAGIFFWYKDYKDASRTANSPQSEAA